MGRLGPLMTAIVAGAHGGDAELPAHLATVNGERLVGTTMVARRRDELGALRSDVSVEQARESVRLLNSVEVWQLLTVQRGWSDDDHESWSARAMADAVL